MGNIIKRNRSFNRKTCDLDKDPEGLVSIGTWINNHRPRLELLKWNLLTVNVFNNIVFHYKLTRFSVIFTEAFIKYLEKKSYKNNKNKIMEITNLVLKTYDELLSSKDFINNDMAYTMMYNDLDLKSWSLRDQLTLQLLACNTQVKADKAGSDNNNEYRTKIINDLDEILSKVDYETQLKELGDLFEHRYFELFFDEKLEKYEG